MHHRSPLQRKRQGEFAPAWMEVCTPNLKYNVNFVVIANALTAVFENGDVAPQSGVLNCRRREECGNDLAAGRK